MDIRHLKLIETIGRVGTLKEAAKELFVTQSALSHQLKSLESYLGTPVFYRKNNKLSFTPVGKELLEASSDILDKFDNLEARVQQIQKNQLNKYVHGYSAEETKRLYDQASSIEQFLHWDSIWEEGSVILEAGCGVGAQTKIIADKNPNSTFISVDISEKSLQQARESIQKIGLNNVEFLQADLFALPFPKHHFNHIFVCFVLEHVSKPEQMLKELKRVLRPGGTITLVEGDHGSTFFHPHSVAAEKAVAAQVTLQKLNGGDANIGRRLYPILSQAGFSDIRVSPRQIYVDDSKPDLVKGFTLNTFTAMIEGVASETVSQDIISHKEMERGIQDLKRTAAGGGSFCYTFFKAKGVKE